jgi:hypothetical protein
MHPAAKFQFERVAREFAQWRAVPEQDDRKQTTIWQIPHRRSDTGHGTQKPIECMRRLETTVRRTDACQAIGR